MITSQVRALVGSSVLAAATLAQIAMAQSVPSTFVNAEKQTPTPVPADYNYYSSSNSSGTRSVTGLGVGHVLGVTAEGQLAGNGTTVDSKGKMDIQPGSQLSNTFGQDGKSIVYETKSNQNGTTPGTQSQTTSYTTNGTATIQGIGAIGNVNLTPTSNNCSTSCINGTQFNVNTTLAPVQPSTQTNPAASPIGTATGTAKGFLNSNITAENSSNSFSNVLLQSF